MPLDDLETTDRNNPIIEPQLDDMSLRIVLDFIAMVKSNDHINQRFCDLVAPTLPVHPGIGP